MPVNEDRPRASDAGVFIEGNPEASPLPPRSPKRAVSVWLAAGWRYSFRHLDGNWRNDEAADNYIPKLSGGRDWKQRRERLVERAKTGRRPVRSIHRQRRCGRGYAERQHPGRYRCQREESPHVGPP